MSTHSEHTWAYKGTEMRQKVYNGQLQVVNVEVYYCTHCLTKKDGDIVGRA